MSYAVKKCPVCKKKYVPEPFNVYKITVNNIEKMVCSYKCMREHQKKKENSVEAIRKAERIKKELEGKYEIEN